MEIGKAIYNILTTAGIQEELTIHPEVAPADASLPFVVYSVQNIQPADTKSSSSQLDDATLEVYTMGQNYSECMEIAQGCRTALDRNSGSFSGVQVQSIQFNTADIGYNEPQECYIVEQIYSVRIQVEGQAPSAALLPLSASTITIQEADGTPSANCSTLRFPGGTLSIASGVANYSPVYEVASFTPAASLLKDGANAIDFSSSTPTWLPFAEEEYSSGSGITATAQGIISFAATGVYRITASLTFDSTTHGMSPHFYFQIESRIITGEAGGMIPAQHEVDHQPANLSRVIPITAGERLRIYAYDESSKSGNIYCSSAIVDVERTA